MPSVASPYGFKPAHNAKLRCLKAGIATNYSTPLYRGDVLKLLDTGKLAQADAGGVYLYGVFSHCRYRLSNGDVKTGYWPGAAAEVYEVWYYPIEPGVEFQVQANATTTAAIIGDACDHVIGTGNAASGVSGASIGISTAAGAGNQAQWRIVRAAPGPNNDITDTYPDLIVTGLEIQGWSATAQAAI